MATPEDQVRIVYVLTARDLASAKVAAVNQSITRGTGNLNKELAKTDTEAAKTEKSLKGLSAETKKADRDIDTFSKHVSTSSTTLDHHSRSVNKVTTSYENLGRRVHQIGVRDAVDDFKSLDSEADRLGGTARRVTGDMDRLGRSIRRATSAGGGGDRGGFRKLMEDLGNFGKGIPIMPLAIVGGIGALGGPVLGAISNLVGLVGQLVAGLGALGSAWAPAFGGAAAFVPAFASLGAVMGTVILSSHNLMQVFKGNIGVFNQVAPSMLNFVRQVQDLHNAFIGLTKAVQQPIFAGLSRGLQAITRSGLLGTLRSGFRQTAVTLGGAAQQTGEFFAQRDSQQRISRTFGAIQPLLGGIAPIAQNLFKVFTNLTVAAAPLAKWMENVVTRFTQFLSLRTGNTSRMTDFFQKTEQAIRSMWTVLSQFGAGLYHILQQARPLGLDLANSLGQAATNFNKWTQSVTGRETIASYFKTIGPSIKETAGLISDLTKGIIRLGNNRSVQQFVTVLRNQLGPALGQIFRNSASLGPQLATVAADLVKLVAALPLQAMTVFTTALENLIHGLTWLIQNIPAAKAVMTGLAVVLGGLATLKFVGLVSGLSKIVELAGLARSGSLIGALRGPGAAGGAAQAAGAAETSTAMAPLVAALETNTAALAENTAALLGRGFTGRSGSTMLFGPTGTRTPTPPVEGELGTAAREAGGVGLLGRAASFFKSPAGVAGGVALGGSLIASGVGAAIGGRTGSTISTVGGLAATGATIGSFFPGWGTAIGAAVGGLAGLVISLHHTSQAAQDFANALNAAAKSGQVHAAALATERQARQALPSARADVHQADIGLQQARQQRQATLNDLVARFAAARNVNLQTASPQQIAQLRDLSKRTDEYKSAQDQVTYALQAQRQARQALGDDLRTISRSTRDAAHSAQNFTQQIRNISDDSRKLQASTFAHLMIEDPYEKTGKLRDMAISKSVDDYISKVKQLGQQSHDPAFKRLADTAAQFAAAIHGIPQVRNVKLAMQMAKDTGVTIAQAIALVMGKTPKEVKRQITATIKFETKDGLPASIAAQLAAGTLKPGQIQPNVLAAINRAQQAAGQAAQAGTGRTGTGADQGTVKPPPPTATGNRQPLSTQAIQNQIDQLAAQLAHAQAVTQAQITRLGLDPNSPKALQLQQQLLATTQNNTKQQIALYQKEIAVAKKMHADPQQILQLRSQVAQLQDTVITNAADMVANARAIIQARFEYAAQQLDLRAQLFDIRAQSLGLRAQASPLQAPRLEARAARDISKEIGLLRQEQKKYAAEARDQALTAEQRRQAQLNAANLTNEILQKQADRQAAIQAGFDIRASVFGNRAQLADLQAQGAQLQAQLAAGPGATTFASGAVIAALEKEIPQLRKEEAVYAKAAKDRSLSAAQRQQDQIKAQEIQNEILQKQLEIQQLMQQQVANALSRVGGSLSFGFNSQQFTDVISSGTGA